MNNLNQTSKESMKNSSDFSNAPFILILTSDLRPPNVDKFGPNVQCLKKFPPGVLETLRSQKRDEHEITATSDRKNL